ncbi:hypothetical protein BDQ17DRAFT_1336785 [Cyathus striatus]|nr:hypothetical protein BDQ17DRAFT_1336785 [Cyathus striatus]
MAEGDIEHEGMCDMLSGSVGGYEQRHGKEWVRGWEITQLFGVEFLAYNFFECQSSGVKFLNYIKFEWKMCKNSAITSSIKFLIIPLAFDALMVIVSHFFHHRAQQGMGNNEHRGAIADFSSYSVKELGFHRIWIPRIHLEIIQPNGIVICLSLSTQRSQLYKLSMLTALQAIHAHCSLLYKLSMVHVSILQLNISGGPMV